MVMSSKGKLILLFKKIILPNTEFFSYLLFSILVGHVVLQTVPDSKKPKVSIQKRVSLLSTLGIIICTFVPVLQVILYFKENVGLITAIMSVLTYFHLLSMDEDQRLTAMSFFLAVCLLILLNHYSKRNCIDANIYTYM